MKTYVAPDYRTDLPNGLICRVALQCTDPLTGKLGDWLFSGETWRATDARVTPVFGSFEPLARWAHANGFASVGYDYVYSRTAILKATQP